MNTIWQGHVINHVNTICKHETTLEALDLKKEFDVIMEEFGPEVLDENLKLYEEHVDEQRQKEDEAREVHINRVKQETLFEMKLEAFESDLIKNSKDKELKKMIRKAKTLIEVQAFSTILIQKELELQNVGSDT